MCLFFGGVFYLALKGSQRFQPKYSRSHNLAELLLQLICGSCVDHDRDVLRRCHGRLASKWRNSNKMYRVFLKIGESLKFSQNPKKVFSRIQPKNMCAENHKPMGSAALRFKSSSAPCHSPCSISLGWFHLASH